MLHLINPDPPHARSFGCFGARIAIFKNKAMRGGYAKFFGSS